MTTQERLREAAKELRRRHPRPSSLGVFVDELCERAADEMDRHLQHSASLAVATMHRDDRFAAK